MLNAKKEPPPFSPLRSGPKAASKPSRQKQIPISVIPVLATFLMKAKTGKERPFELIQSLEISDFQHRFEPLSQGDVT